MTKLPLSFTLNKDAVTAEKTRLWRASFLSNGSSPSAAEFYSEVLRRAEHEAVVIRGVGINEAEHLKRRGFWVHQTGAEATLLLQAFRPSPSVRALESRARRTLKIEQTETLPDFSRISGDTPQLKHLYREFRQSHDFILAARDGSRTYGWLSLSRRSKEELQLEVMRRETKRCPAGTMELLILSAIRLALEHGAQRLSLGEVPFVLGRRIYERMVFAAARIALGKSYSVKGLFAFKQKFHPTWSPVFLVSSTSFALPELYALARRTNTTRLIGFCVSQSLKTSAKTP